MYGQHSRQSMDKPGKNVNPARSQLNREINISRLKISPRKTGSALLFWVSLLILYSQAESGAAYSRDSSQFPRGCLFIQTAIRYRVSPEFIGSRTYVPMAFTAESPSAQGR